MPRSPAKIIPSRNGPASTVSRKRRSATVGAARCRQIRNQSPTGPPDLAREAEPGTRSRRAARPRTREDPLQGRQARRKAGPDSAAEEAAATPTKGKAATRHGEVRRQKEAKENRPRHLHSAPANDPARPRCRRPQTPWPGSTCRGGRRKPRARRPAQIPMQALLRPDRKRNPLFKNGNDVVRRIARRGRRIPGRRAAEDATAH